MQLRGGDNVGSDEYPVTTTLELDILIRNDGGICRNQKSSAYENCGGGKGPQYKEGIRHTSTQQKLGREENTNLVPGKDGTTLNSTCYNCHNPGHLAYNFPEAGRTGTCFLQIIHRLTQKQTHQNYPINNNCLLLDTFSSASFLKINLWQKMSDTETQRIKY